MKAVLTSNATDGEKSQVQNMCNLSSEAFRKTQWEDPAAKAVSELKDVSIKRIKSKMGGSGWYKDVIVWMNQAAY